MEHGWIVESAKAALIQFAEKKIGEAPTLPDFTLQTPPPGMSGDFTLVLFPYLKPLQTRPDELGNSMAETLCKDPRIEKAELIKGFLNLTLSPAYWAELLANYTDWLRGKSWKTVGKGEGIVLEYPSPNTNKPLHLGHLRNIFLGDSLAEIYTSLGYTVYKVNLYNDRGTNISKSMYAYLKSEAPKTPEEAGLKGDKLVGDYYVQYNDLHRNEVKIAVAAGKDEEKAKLEVPSAKAIADLTVKWEHNDPEVRKLWETMNGWFYQGVNQTFARLGLQFDAVYYESKIYDKGREAVEEGLKSGVFYQKEDGSVWIDLTDAGLDHKLVLRSNGTTVYITQDIALAYQKAREFEFNRSVYVVGNEQDYHFKVLFEILKRLNLKASGKLHHLSYGMVELPEGKMKSREGTVVDADDLLQELTSISRSIANEQGKLGELDEKEKEYLYQAIGQGALRYFILRVDPVKRMVFNPKESIDFNGETGPFIQYMHARSCSLLRNAASLNLKPEPQTLLKSNYSPSPKEVLLMRHLYTFPEKLKEAANSYSPAIMAHYAYATASIYSQFYHDHPVLKEQDAEAQQFRLCLSDFTRTVLNQSLSLLKVHAPERM
jgi:arginyl-tRNA synthetase